MRRRSHSYGQRGRGATDRALGPCRAHAAAGPWLSGDAGEVTEDDDVVAVLVAGVGGSAAGHETDLGLGEVALVDELGRELRLLEGRDPVDREGQVRAVATGDLDDVARLDPSQLVEDAGHPRRCVDMSSQDGGSELARGGPRAVEPDLLCSARDGDRPVPLDA